MPTLFMNASTVDGSKCPPRSSLSSTHPRKVGRPREVPRLVCRLSPLGESNDEADMDPNFSNKDLWHTRKRLRLCGSLMARPAVTIGMCVAWHRSAIRCGTKRTSKPCRFVVGWGTWQSRHKETKSIGQGTATDPGAGLSNKRLLSRCRHREFMR